MTTWNLYRLGGDSQAQIRMAEKIRDKVMHQVADIYDTPTAPALDLRDGSVASTDQTIRDAEWAILMEAIADKYSNLRSARWWIDNKNSIDGGTWRPDLAEVLTEERVERIRTLRGHAAPTEDAAPAPAVEEPKSSRQIAEMLGVSLSTVYRRIKAGLLAAVKDAMGHWVITSPVAA